MEYLDDEQAVLNEIVRVMRSGGVAVITLPNFSSVSRRWLRLLNRVFLVLRRWFPRSQRLQNLEFMVGPFTKGITHREYVEAAYRQLLKGYGLDVVDTCYYNFHAEDFARQMQWLRERERVLSLTELLEHYRHGRDVDGVVVTFDAETRGR